MVAKEILPIQIGKYYLKVELGKSIKDKQSKFLLRNFIDSLGEIDFWNLLKTISLECRKNNIYNLLRSREFIWHKEKVKFENIVLGKINEKVNPYLESVNFNPVKFRDIIKNPNNSFDVKEALQEFSCRDIDESELDYIFTVENDKFIIWDGAHRFMSQVLNENLEISGYVGKKIIRPSLELSNRRQT